MDPGTGNFKALNPSSKAADYSCSWERPSKSTKHTVLAEGENTLVHCSLLISRSAVLKKKKALKSLRFFEPNYMLAS
jgi:hypothetical protein